MNAGRITRWASRLGCILVGTLLVAIFGCGYEAVGSALPSHQDETESPADRSTASTSPASTYYVAPDGHDLNPGTEALPWRTIQKAADTLVAGDTVYIKAGVYEEQVIPQNSGSPGSYIAISGE